jgi:hypothetical protein
MSNWPVITLEAEFERDQLLTSHRPIPLPAYDINGRHISPDRCKTMLGGAIARVTFTLNHWIINPESTMTKKDKSNTLIADIHSIQILVNSSSQTIAPRKRKTFEFDPSDQMVQKVGKKIFMK